MTHRPVRHALMPRSVALRRLRQAAFVTRHSRLRQVEPSAATSLATRPRWAHRPPFHPHGWVLNSRTQESGVGWCAPSSPTNGSRSRLWRIFRDADQPGRSTVPRVRRRTCTDFALIYRSVGAGEIIHGMCARTPKSRTKPPPPDGPAVVRSDATQNAATGGPNTNTNNASQSPGRRRSSKGVHGGQTIEVEGGTSYDAIHGPDDDHATSGLRPAAQLRSGVDLAPDLVPLLPAARAARDQLLREGVTISRDALAQRLRRDGNAIRNNRVSELLAALKFETLHSPRLHS